MDLRELMAEPPGSESGQSNGVDDNASAEGAPEASSEARGGAGGPADDAQGGTVGDEGAAGGDGDGGAPEGGDGGNGGGGDGDRGGAPERAPEAPPGGADGAPSEPPGQLTEAGLRGSRRGSGATAVTAATGDDDGTKSVATARSVRSRARGGASSSEDEEEKNEALKAARKKAGYGELKGELYIKEREFLRKSGVLMNTENGRTWSADVEMIQRGPLWLLRFRNVHVNNPLKCRLNVYVTTRPTNDKLQNFKRHAAILKLDITKAGFCHRTPREFDQPIRIDELAQPTINHPRDILSVCIAKPPDQKPMSSEPSRFSFAALQDVPETWSLDPDIKDRIVELEDRIRDSLPSSKVKSAVEGKSYHELKKTAREMFEAMGHTKDENIKFDEWLVLLRTLKIILTEAKRTELFRAGDPGNTGEIDVIEFQFLLFASTMVFKQKWPTPHDLFFMIDERDIGLVDEVDIYSILHASKIRVKEEKVRAAFSELDTKGRRLVDFDCFLQMWVRFCEVEMELRRRGETVSRGWRRKKQRAINEATLLEAVRREADEIRNTFRTAVSTALEARKQNRRERDERHRARNAARRVDPAVARKLLADKNRAFREKLKAEALHKRERDAEEGVRKAQVRQHRDSRQKLVNQLYRERVEQSQRDDHNNRLDKGWDTLDLNGKDLRHWPPELHTGRRAQNKLAHLVSLILHHNRLDFIPPRSVMFWLAALQKLDCSFNIFKELPGELDALAVCKIFNFRANRLGPVLGPEVGKLPAVEVMDLSSNGLVTLPEEMGRLSTLRELRLHTNRMETLPEALADLGRLETLDVSNNVLYRLPLEFGRRNTSLRRLFLQHNNISYLPDDVSGLTALRVLDVSDNQLTRLPRGEKGVVNWKSLARCVLVGNRLATLGDGIEGWVSLVELDVSKNKVLNIPDGLGKMTHLQHLCLRDNQIPVVPPTLGYLTELQLLDVSYNKLLQIPVEIGGCKSLRQMNASHNILGAEPLPMSVGTLFSLEWLDISHNAVRKLPRQLSTLNELKYINLAFNKFEEVPAHLARCVALTSLIMTANKLKQWPVEHCGLSLTSLDLAANRIHELPGEIGDMTTLRHLWLYNNALRALPPRLSELLPHLITFEAGRNPFKDIPGKFASERLPEAEKLGLRFVPKTRLKEVSSTFKTHEAAMKKRKADTRMLPKGRMLPKDKNDDMLEGQVAVEAGAATFADFNLALDPRPKFGAGVLQPAYKTHSKDREKRLALQENEELLHRLTQKRKRGAVAKAHFVTELSKGYTDAQAAEWAAVQSVFHSKALEEWEASGWWHYLGKSTVDDFEKAMRARLGPEWDDVLLKEVRRFYFTAKRDGVPPEYEEVRGAQLEWRLRMSRQALAERTARAGGAIGEHKQRLQRERAAYSFDPAAAEARYAELMAMNAITVRRKKEDQVRHLRTLMGTVLPRQVKTESKIAARKRLQELATLDELRHYAETRAEKLDAVEAVRKAREFEEELARAARPRLLSDIDDTKMSGTL